ncbi:MAG: hypothetical protein ACLPV4_09890 [Solirubrobacteraceae bacterium]
MTVYGLAFINGGTPSMSYGGGVSCAGGVGQKTVNVVPEVGKAVNGQQHWYVIGGIGLYQGPTPVNPLRVSGTTSFVAGHVYRLLVYGGVTLPDGRTSSMTICSGCAPSTSPLPTLRVTGYDRNEPFPPRTVPIKGIAGLSCSVTEFGPVFKIVNLTYVDTYAGSTSCFGAKNVGQRTLTICAQVSNRSAGKTAWYTIAGSCLSNKLTATSPVYLTTGRTAYQGHGYRIKASATVKYATSSAAITKSATVYGAEAAP